VGGAGWCQGLWGTNNADHPQQANPQQANANPAHPANVIPANAANANANAGPLPANPAGPQPADIVLEPRFADVEGRLEQIPPLEGRIIALERGLKLRVKVLEQSQGGSGFLFSRWADLQRQAIDQERDIQQVRKLVEELRERKEEAQQAGRVAALERQIEEVFRERDTLREQATQLQAGGAGGEGRVGHNE